MKNLNAFLITSGILLVIFNMTIISNFGLEESRWTRFASVLCYFLLFLYVSPQREKYLVGSLGLLVLSDLVRVYYEQPYFKTANFIMVILAYLLLILHVAPWLKKLRTNTFQKVVYVLALGINTILLYFVADIVEIGIERSLFYIYGILMILLVTCAYSMVNRYSSKASFFFICAVMGFLFSDISGFIAYYIQVGIFYFPDRLFYLLGLISLVKYSSLERTRAIGPDYEGL